MVVAAMSEMPVAPPIAISVLLSFSQDPLAWRNDAVPSEMMV